MRPLADERGLAVLYTVLLLPMVILLLAFVVELGALRVERARLLAAADLAATAATTEQDRAALARDGRYRLSPEAEHVARNMLAAELEPLSSILAAGATVSGIAAVADIDVFEGGFDPVTGRTYDAPTVRIAFHVPLRTPLFALAGLRDVTVVRIAAAASAR